MNVAKIDIGYVPMKEFLCVLIVDQFVGMESLLIVRDNFFLRDIYNRGKLNAIRDDNYRW